MNSVKIVFLCFVSCCLCCFSPDSMASSYNLDHSFQKLIKTDSNEWKINVRNFTLRLENSDRTFKLNMSSEGFFRYSAFQGGTELKNRISPLKMENKDLLNTLFNRAMIFSGQKKKEKYSMGMNWESYPESILKWAEIWQDSDLRKNWHQTEKYSRYNALTSMISDFLKKDMKPVINAIGFRIQNADMEKMAFYKPDQLNISQESIKNKGIDKDIKIPAPLMLYLVLKPIDNPVSDDHKNTVTDCRCKLDKIFVTAKLNSTNIYGVFNRELNEYEITGDTVSKNGKYEHILPMADKNYQNIAGDLLNAILKASYADEKQAVFLRTNLKQYPEIYKAAVKYFNRTSTPVKKIKRPELPGENFFEYQPELKSDSSLSSVSSFLEKTGYVLKAFEMSLNSKRRAGKYPEYKKIFKPLGIKPDAKAFVPDIVYLKALRRN